MGILDLFRKPELKASRAAPTSPGGDVVERTTDGVFKAYIPQFLWKPPFGYPRGDNVPLIKQMARNAYVFGITNMLMEEAAWCDWEIKPVDGVEMTPELEAKKKDIREFLINPNANKEGWSHIVKTAVRDICEIDAGVWVKVFGRDQRMKQIFARDGGVFLKNPDIFGNLGNREDIIFPDQGLLANTMNEQQAINSYRLLYQESAAYFQYGWQTAQMPIPFGRREIVYFMKSPRSDSVYGTSPVAILTDVILTLIYGSQYNLDFYMNSNMPEGILSIVGAPGHEVKAIKERLKNSIQKPDPLTGFMRKVGFMMPVVNTQATFTPFQIPSREMQIIEQQSWFTKIVWMCYGISADDLGFTENSNKAVSQEQGKKYARKAVRPILNLIAERVNMEIIPEFGTTDLMFEFDDYDLDADIKRHTLLEQQIRMGIKTPLMVAEEEHIDVARLEKEKQEKLESEMALNDADAKDNTPHSPSTSASVKSSPDLEKELLEEIDKKGKMLKQALKRYGTDVKDAGKGNTE